MTTSKAKIVKSKNIKKPVKPVRAKTLKKAGAAVDAPVRVNPLPEKIIPAALEKYYGVYPAVVTDMKDPSGLGRVKVELPWLNQSNIPAKFRQKDIWARLATLMAGNNSGTWFIPDVNHEVLVAFEGGDSRHPYVIGSLWNGADTPPESMDAQGANNRKLLRSRNGVKITINDTDGTESLILETPAGQKISLVDGSQKINIEDGSGNSLELAPAGITINAAARVTVNSSMVEVNAGMIKASGVVKCDTLIANSVVSSSYTPGAGNIW